MAGRRRLTLAWVAVVSLCAWLLWPMLARAQEMDVYQHWIHEHKPACCDHRDCKPAAVTWTPDGWRVLGGNNIVPFAQVIAWPFAQPYACVVAGHLRCLLMTEGM